MSDASGSMKLSVVAEENPFSMAMLLSEECFILDNGAARKIFVWKGKRTLPLKMQKKHNSKETVQHPLNSQNFILTGHNTHSMGMLLPWRGQWIRIAHISKGFKNVTCLKTLSIFKTSISLMLKCLPEQQLQSKHKESCRFCALLPNIYLLGEIWALKV